MNAPRSLGLLRARRERPCGRAAEQRHELPAPHGTPPQALPTITTPLRKRADVADGSIASDYQSKRPRRMSALPPIATDLMPRNELTRSVNSDHAKCQQKNRVEAILRCLIEQRVSFLLLAEVPSPAGQQPHQASPSFPT